MEPEWQMSDEEYIQKMLEARRMDPVKKLLLPGRLFDQECLQAKAEIRKQHPAASEERVRELLREWVNQRRVLKGKDPLGK